MSGEGQPNAPHEVKHVDAWHDRRQVRADVGDLDFLGPAVAFEGDDGQAFGLRQRDHVGIGFVLPAVEDVPVLVGELVDDIADDLLLFIVHGFEEFRPLFDVGEDIVVFLVQFRFDFFSGDDGPIVDQFIDAVPQLRKRRRRTRGERR